MGKQGLTHSRQGFVHSRQGFLGTGSAAALPAMQARHIHILDNEVFLTQASTTTVDGVLVKVYSDTGTYLRGWTNSYKNGKIYVYDGEVFLRQRRGTENWMYVTDLSGVFIREWQTTDSCLNDFVVFEGELFTGDGVGYSPTSNLTAKSTNLNVYDLSGNYIRQYSFGTVGFYHLKIDIQGRQLVVTYATTKLVQISGNVRSVSAMAVTKIKMDGTAGTPGYIYNDTGNFYEAAAEGKKTYTFRGDFSSYTACAHWYKNTSDPYDDNCEVNTYRNSLTSASCTYGMFAYNDNLFMVEIGKIKVYHPSSNLVYLSWGT